MLANTCLSNVEQAAIETQQIDRENLGATANNKAFLINPDSGVYYNVFMDVWRRANRHFKGNHGHTHR